MTITKKITSGFFDDIASGKKKFELRVADFDIHEGDVLILEEWSGSPRKATGRKITTKATYVLKTRDLPFKYPEEDVQKYGFQVIQIERI